MSRSFSSIERRRAKRQFRKAILKADRLAYTLGEAHGNAMQAAWKAARKSGGPR